MSMQDPLADMLTRIRNAQMAKKPSVHMPSSKTKLAVAKVLEQEGYVSDVKVEGEKPATLSIGLKYHQSGPAIREIKRISRPGLRQYRGTHNLPRVSAGLGVTIVTTNKGVMTDRQARAQGVGGEVICTVF